MKRLLSGIAALVLLVPTAAAQAWEGPAGAESLVQIARMRTLAQTAPALPSAPALRTGPAHEPAALSALLDLVERTARSGRTPVVMFDLDDTLIDTGYRQMAIFKEYAAQADVRSRFPDAARRMGAVQYGDLHYDIGDTLKALGVAETAAILPDLTPFWAARFFDNGYLLFDQANTGGVDYVKEVLRRGGKAVYLTGRWEEMRPGTAGSMARMGYPPADGKSVILMMKPDRRQSDIDFKKVAFGDIAGLGQVVGGFENEPANVNAYQERFQTGIYIFLDTRHSTTNAVPASSIFWVGDFRY